MTEQGTFAIEPWVLRETHLDLAKLAQSESVFALANGYVGWRGNLEEGEPHGLPGSYLNGVYEVRPLPYAEVAYGLPETGQSVINVTNGKLIRLFVDDEPFDVRYGELRSHERLLDFRAGVLNRNAEWVSPAGRPVRVSSTRLVSFTQRSVAAICYEVEPLDGPARFAVQSELVANEQLPTPASADPRAAAVLEAPLVGEYQNAAFHINADIADAVIRYVDATGDEAFDRGPGMDLLTHTARLWLSLGHHDLEGRFRIDGITGPDEYSAIVDNNVYTNLMAQQNLRAAADAAKRYPDRARELGIDAEEAGSWRDAAEDMFIPYDEALGVHPQDEDFTRHEVWDFAGTPPENYPLLLNLPYFDLYRKQVVKQADLVLAMYLCPDAFTADSGRQATRYPALRRAGAALTRASEGPPHRGRTGPAATQPAAGAGTRRSPPNHRGRRLTGPARSQGPGSAVAERHHQINLVGPGPCAHDVSERDRTL